MPGRLTGRLWWERRKLALRRRLTRRSLAAESRAAEYTVLIFAPEGGVDPHFSTMALAGRTLKDLGEKVLMVTCFGGYRRCPVRDNFRLPYDASAPALEQQCVNCAEAAESGLNAYGLDSVHLVRWLSSEARERVRRAIESAPDDLQAFVYDSIEFGRLASMNVALLQKVSDFKKVTPAQRAAWLQYIEASLTSYECMQAMLTRFRPKAVAHYNDYALFLGVKWACRKAGVRCLTLSNPSHHNVDRRRIAVFPSVNSIYVRTLRSEWPKFRELPLPAEMVRDIQSDLLTRFQSRGSHIYSPAKQGDAGDVRASFGLEAGRKLLVAFSSSLDEWTAVSETELGWGYVTPAHGPVPFRSQVEWLTAVMDFVEASSDLSLVIRIHPREGKNRRDSVESQHLQLLRSALDLRNRRHCRVVWPEDPVSSYDLGEAADVALVSASNIGLELARAGVPVIATEPEQGFFPVDDFLRFEPTAAAYFSTLRKLLDSGDDDLPGRVMRAFRWYHLFNLSFSVDYSNMIPDPHWTKLRAYERPALASDLRAALIDDVDVKELSLHRLRSQPVSAATEERATLVLQLGRLLHFLFTAQDGMLPAGARFSIDGDAVTYFDGTREYRRVSPMARRIVQAVFLSA